VFSKGGEQGLSAEALTTQGRVLSKRGNFVESVNTLRRAADLAEEAGAVEDAGRALLSLMEEHADRLNEHELNERPRCKQRGRSFLNTILLCYIRLLNKRIPALETWILDKIRRRKKYSSGQTHSLIGTAGPPVGRICPLRLMFL
jgi:hypothetical protein